MNHILTYSRTDLLTLSARAAIAVSICLAAMLAGCRPSSPTPARESGQPVGSLQSRTDRGEVLLDAVVQQLGNLASYVDTELRPPVVILDARKSGTGSDVLATFTTHPVIPDGPINYVFVHSGNGRFRSLGVRSGDVLKFSYVRYDPQGLESDVGETVTLDLTVAQVLNDNALLIEVGLNQPVSVPQKIEIWRYPDDRLEEIERQLLTYVNIRQPVFGWEPSGDERALKQIIERLNQWMHQSQPKVDWSAAELTATLDTQIASDERLAPLISAEALAAPVFQPYEGRLLQEAIWLRDISRWAQGESFDDVARATALFDWTIRNIQLDAEGDAMPNRPWQTLIYGHGTSEQRAWVFALLGRQQGLDVVVLSVPGPAKPPADGDTEGEAGPAEDSIFWLPALLSEGQLYLFDTRLGLPIPGPGGEGVATLAAVQADDSLLHQLDLEDAAYPVTAAQVREVTANVVASPFDLSRRAKAFEAKLSGDDRLILTSQTDKLAAKLAAMSTIASVRIWEFPFRTLQEQLYIGPPAERRRWAQAFAPFARRPTLWKARVLHFQGHRSADGDAEYSDVEEFSDDHDQAVRIYTSRSVRPTDRLINTLSSESERRIHTTAKTNASYWVGLLLFDGGKFESAEDWFSNPKLAAGADDQWASGTRYNLARTYEAEGKFDEAIALYDRDTSPQRHGNRLRARWLKAKLAQPPAAD